jgi:hypothetical protein
MVHVHQVQKHPVYNYFPKHCPVSNNSSFTVIENMQL